MFRTTAAIVLVMAVTVPALAALPPQYQRQRELQAVIDSLEVVDAFGFDGIESIEYVDIDVYRVRGGGCRIDVRIVDVPAEQDEGRAGPRQFTLGIGDKVCD